MQIVIKKKYKKLLKKQKQYDRVLKDIRAQNVQNQ